MRWMLCVLVVSAPLAAAAQPFERTVFISPNVLTAADPTSLIGIQYTGRGERVIYDRRFDAWVTVNAYLFQVSYEQAARRPEPGRTAGQLEFQVNPEFGSPEAAQVEVEAFAPALGRLPLVVIARLADIHVNAGDESFGAGVSGLAHSITIHTGYGHRMSGEGFLEEVLFHAGAHSLDEQHADSAGWRAAQEADGAFISAYARDNPDRGDLAESLLAYFAARIVPGRFSEADRAAIEATIPHRLAYFDDQSFDWSPFGTPVPALPAGAAAILVALLAGAGWRTRARRDWPAPPSKLLGARSLRPRSVGIPCAGPVADARARRMAGASGAAQRAELRRRRRRLLHCRRQRDVRPALRSPVQRRPLDHTRWRGPRAAADRRHFTF